MNKTSPFTPSAVEQRVQLLSKLATKQLGASLALTSAAFEEQAQANAKLSAELSDPKNEPTETARKLFAFAQENTLRAGKLVMDGIESTVSGFTQTASILTSQA